MSQLPNPFKAASETEGPRIKIPPVRPGELARMYILLAGLVFLILAMVGLRVWMKKEDQLAERRGHPTDYKLRTESAEYKLSLKLRESARRFADGETPIDSGSLAHTVALIGADLPGQRLADLANHRLNLPTIHLDPARHRGEVVKLKVRVASTGREADLPFAEGLAAGSDLPVRVFTMEPLPETAAEGAWLDAYAVFLRASGAERRLTFLARSAKPGLPPQEPKGPDATPAPSGAPEAQALPDPECQDLFRRLAATFKDDPDSISAEVDYESPEFLAAAQALGTSLDADQARRLAADVPLRDLVADPGKHRGSLVRIQGRLIYIYTRPLSVTNPGKIDTVYEGYLADMVSPMGKKIPVTFFLTQRPEGDFRVQRNSRGEVYYSDWVELEGVFLRLYRYEGTVERSDLQVPVNIAPVLLVKNLRILPTPKQTATPKGYIAIIGTVGAIVAVLVVILGIVIRRRDSASMRMEVLKGKREKLAAAGKSILPQGSGPILGEEVKRPEPPNPPA